MKTCIRCNVDKPLSEFHRDCNGLNGYRAECRDCRKVARANPVTRSKQTISYMKHKGMPIDLTAVEIAWTLGDCRCSYCGTELAFEQTTLDHITPSNRQGANTFDNTTVSCKSCNSRKGDRPALLYMLSECEPYHNRKLLEQMALRRGISVQEAFVELALDAQRYFEQRQASDSA